MEMTECGISTSRSHDIGGYKTTHMTGYILKAKQWHHLAGKMVIGVPGSRG